MQKGIGTIHILVILALLIFAGGVGYFWLFGNQYYFCEDGLYYTYPRGFTDAGIVWYGKNDKELARCSSWGIFEGQCKEIYNRAGKCVQGFFIRKWFRY